MPARSYRVLKLRTEPGAESVVAVVSLDLTDDCWTVIEQFTGAHRLERARAYIVEVVERQRLLEDN